MGIRVRTELPSARRKPEKYKQDVAKAIAKFAVNTLNELRDYPPPPPKSTYRRTYHLRDSWRPKKTQTSVTIANDAEYATFLHGPDTVDWAHDYGWPQLDEVVEEHREALLEDIEEAAHAAAGIDS